MTTNNPITVDQMKEISETMIRAVPQDLPFTAALRWTHSKRLLIKKVREILSDDGTRNNDIVLREWEMIYAKYFQTKKDFSGILIPEAQQGHNRLLIVSKGMLLNQTLRVCSDIFPTHSEVLSEFGDCLNEMTRSERAPTEDYALWVNDVAEAEIAPWSPMGDMPPHPPVPEMTLLERLLLEIKYFSETGEHLDTEKATCCFGTTHIEGDERPVVCWRDNRLQILWRKQQYTEVLMSCSPYWSRSIIV